MIHRNRFMSRGKYARNRACGTFSEVLEREEYQCLYFTGKGLKMDYRKDFRRGGTIDILILSKILIYKDILNMTNI